jgi:hypothetical protein
MLIITDVTSLGPLSEVTAEADHEFAGLGAQRHRGPQRRRIPRWAPYAWVPTVRLQRATGDDLPRVAEPLVKRSGN